MNERLKHHLTHLKRRLRIRTFRSSLSSLEAAPQFALLGILAGLFTGFIIIAFRWVVETTLNLLLPAGPESFEQLNRIDRFLLPVAGALTLALMFSFLKLSDRQLGVTYVLRRLQQHQGYIPLRSLFIQFIAGALALISGQTGGREGPAIHLGAATSSYLGQVLKLPNNSMRVLIGCGAAAAIGSSFNTPIAGVIFSMEVIVMEYTVAGFMPVILAAVTGTLIVQQVFGDAPIFQVPGIGMDSFWDLPWVLIEGILIAVLAAGLIRLMIATQKHAPQSIVLRFILAGGCTAALGLAVPQILGIGYDSVSEALLGNLPLFMLLCIAATKLIATAVNLGLGMPIGLIGPTLVIGALAGGSFWQLASTFSNTLSEPGFYVILGMGAMMGAALQAPLAALMALVELTRNPEIVLPAMACIVVAHITVSNGFRLPSIFQAQATMLGQDLHRNAMSLTLSRASVESVMSRNFVTTERYLTVTQANALLTQKPDWILIKDEDNNLLLSAADLSRALASSEVESTQDQLDLKSIPGERKNIAKVTWQATLDEAFDIIAREHVEALYVVRVPAPLVEHPVGIVLPTDIERFYKS